VAAYRIGSEALSNAARHSGADCVELGLAVEEGALVVRVSDTGRGVRSSTVGVGATSMRSRAVELGGRVTVRDTEGGGTTVEARLPLGSVPT
jgi:signal transduction histidine kinase